MLAFRERDERVGCVGSSGHSSRVSLEAAHLDRMATGHVERVGRGCRVGYTDPSRVGPSPTQRPACHADRVGRLAGFAVQRGGASARTHGWDTIAPRHTGRPGGAAIFQPRGRRGRLYVRGFLSMGLSEPLLPPKTTVKMSVHRVHGRT